MLLVVVKWYNFGFFYIKMNTGIVILKEKRSVFKKWYQWIEKFTVFSIVKKFTARSSFVPLGFDLRRPIYCVATMQQSCPNYGPGGTGTTTGASSGSFSEFDNFEKLSAEEKWKSNKNWLN